MEHTATDDINAVKEVAEIIAATLCNRENHFSVEVRDSVVWTRIYIGASKESTGEHYIIQIDKN